MDKSWMRTSRTKKQYIDGVEAFIKYAVHNVQKMRNIDPRGNKQQLMMPCPCTTCLNHIEHKVEEVQFHLFKYRIDLSYIKWDKHGEKDEQATTAQIPINATTKFVDDTDFDMDFGLEIPTDAPAIVEMVNAIKESFDDLAKFQELLLDAEKPLYKGCPDFTKLSAIVKLLNLKGKYGASDKFFTELLGLLKKMLPAGNEMVEKTYQAKKLMRMIGSGYKKIHVCSNNCILYWKDNKEYTVCPTCGISRWKVDNKTHKVYENIPAKAWRTIDEKFPEIAKDPRNLRLGISADGVEVNSGTRHHSVWPFLSVIYNLPPWLCMKRKFIMLSVLTSGYLGNDIDVFLEPLVDDLHTLFETGVDTYDASTKENINLHAVMLWTMNDYLALGTLCGCPYSGFKGCVVCGKDTHCVRLSASSKQSYAGHRRYLPYNHPFKRQKKAFNGQQEFQLAPNPLTGEQIYNEIREAEVGRFKSRKRKTTKDDGSSNQVNEAYWKKFNIWYRKLRYWRHNSVPHCIDFMHVEKNVCESLVGTLPNVLGKTKDGINARLDLAELGIKLELFARQEEDKTTLPPAGYTLTNAEKDIFCETLSNIRVPQGYCSNLSSLVSQKDRKLIGLKSNDYHMLMQEFLPIAIRSIMHPPTRYAIIRFCFLFKFLCRKEISLLELDKIQLELVVTLCLLEKFFPPSFFDIMIHLTMHLTREVKLCGPICFRWMYPFKRCMKVIKRHVRNRNRPEGYIDEETNAKEIIEFFSEYHKTMKTIGIPPDKHVTNENEDGKPLSAGKSSEVSGEVFQKAHLYVIQNTYEIVPYIERHKKVLKTKNLGKRIALLENEHSKSFSKWLREEVERELVISKDSVSKTVRWISYGPRTTIVKYEAYNINGYTFRTKKAIIRRDLHLEDAKGAECLPNNEIFEELARMGLQRKVDALEKDKLAQATKILSLKKRVEKLEKKRKSKPLVLRRLRKISSATRVESSEEASLGAEENASKQGGMISNIDVDAEISLVDETQRLDDDLIFDTTADLGGEEVVVKPAETGVSAALDVEVSDAELAVTTVNSLVTTDSVTITCRFTHAQLKHRDFEEIQGLYNKEKELVDTFVPIGSEEDERRIKTLTLKISKLKRKAVIKKEEQLNTFYVSSNEEEAIDYEVLTRGIKLLPESSDQILNNNFPEGIDLIMWGDLKTMFEANAVDELWKNQED
ncbi:putative transposon, En/Spm-like protein [Tanacetum coccineum]